MKSVLILENTTQSLKIDESVSNATGKYNLGGTFTEFGVRNRNERLYTAEKFIPALNEMNERINTFGVVYGEFDHPDVFDISMKNASHAITKTEYIKESNLVRGNIQLLDTRYGREAKSIVDQNLPLFVSSRAAGVTESDGSVQIKKLFTYDIVADPGFASAKMSSINESCGFTNDANFRIFEMSDESKINDLFNMNKNDLVTKKQLADYSKYLVGEIKNTSKLVNESVKSGKVESKKIDELVSYYESLQEDYNKLVKYLDYIAEKMQFVVNENNELKKTQENLIKHNDYLAENIENSINYSEYIAENLDKNIAYSEYIAENVDKNISYSEYIAESLDKSIAYSEYIAENVDKNIAYSEYIAENLDKSIAYAEYIAENVDDNIAYSEYIAENLDDTIAYSDYLAENLDKSVTYQRDIVNKINESSSKIFENVGDEEEIKLPLPEDSGFELIEDEDVDFEVEKEGEFADEVEDVTSKMEGELDAELGDEEHTGSFEETPDMEDHVESEAEGEFEAEFEEEMESEFAFENKGNKLDTTIDELILEAKKRKASETEEHHFLKFLNKSQVNDFYTLGKEEQEKVIAHINESEYMSDTDVLKLIREALSTTEETLEEKLIRLIPSEVLPKWEKLDETKKASILSQARLYPNLNTENQIEHFWLTRDIKAETSTKQLISESKLIQEDKLSDGEFEAIMERLKQLS